MGVVEAVAAIGFILDLCQIADMIYDMNSLNEPHAYLDNTFVGTAWYYYAEYNGAPTETIIGNVVFNPNTQTDYDAVFSSEYVTAVMNGDKGFSLNASSNPWVMSGAFTTTAGRGAPTTSNQLLFATTQYLYWYGDGSHGSVNNGRIAVIGPTPGSDNSTYVGMTTIPSISNTYTGVAYVPPGDYSYNDLRETLINYYNNKFGLNIDINIGEIPTWEDLQESTEETDETETNSSGFEFDYGEVISPEELESLLNGETYQLDEIDTELPSLDVPELPSEEMPQEVLGVIPALVTGSYELLVGTGLANVFISLAVLICIIKILRGD